MGAEDTGQGEFGIKNGATGVYFSMIIPVPLNDHYLKRKMSDAQKK